MQRDLEIEIMGSLMLSAFMNFPFALGIALHGNSLHYSCKPL